MRGEDIFAMMAVLGLFAMIGFVVYQVMAHRLRMKMVEKGVTNLEISKIKSQSDQSLKYGLVAIALGLAIFMGLIFEDYVPDLGGEFMLAFVPLFIGIALIISAFIEKRREKQTS